LAVLVGLGAADVDGDADLVRLAAVLDRVRVAGFVVGAAVVPTSIRPVLWCPVEVPTKKTMIETTRAAVMARMSRTTLARRRGSSQRPPSSYPSRSLTARSFEKLSVADAFRYTVILTHPPMCHLPTTRRGLASAPESAAREVMSLAVVTFAAAPALLTLAPGRDNVLVVRNAG
jgi:hypothetical protein